MLESDTDEQLLIHIPFMNAVRLSGIIIKSTAHPDQAPKTVKLFVNQPTIGFGGGLQIGIFDKSWYYLITLLI